MRWGVRGCRVTWGEKGKCEGWGVMDEVRAVDK